MNPPGKINIAVIDDDEALCRSLSRFLRAAGMHPSSYLSAENFLADENHSRFDCLVLDIQLGGMSGLKLQKRLAAAGDKTPVIIVTAHDDPEIRAEALAGGCAAFFNKNDSGEDVLQAIRRITGEAAPFSQS